MFPLQSGLLKRPLMWRSSGMPRFGIELLELSETLATLFM